MVKRFTAEQGFTVSALCHSANDHVGTALRLFDSGEFWSFDSAGYLAHLGIELLLKAAILEQIGSFPDSHDLSKLATELAENGAQVTLDNDKYKALDWLNRFSALRYPDPNGLPPIGQRDRNAIHELWTGLLRELPDTLSASIQAIGTEKSGRVLVRIPKF